MCFSQRFLPVAATFASPLTSVPSTHVAKSEHAAVATQGHGPQLGVLWFREAGIKRQQGEGVAAGLLQQGRVAAQVGDPQRRSPVLAGAEQVPWAAKAKVLLGQGETVAARLREGARRAGPAIVRKFGFARAPRPGQVWISDPRKFGFARAPRPGQVWVSDPRKFGLAQ